MCAHVSMRAKRDEQKGKTKSTEHKRESVCHHAEVSKEHASLQHAEHFRPVVEVEEGVRVHEEASGSSIDK